VRILSSAACLSLVGAIELVSPGNKDRLEARRAFAAKCVAYLTRGIGLIVADIVTNRLANMHNEIVASLGHSRPFTLDESMATYAVAYRPARRSVGDQIEIWPRPLTVGDSLPILPLALRGAETVPVDLDETYHEACVRSRLD
ncbi:MAG TPA: DUF4058 family protein, partial [Pirellulales bacterium]